MNRGDRVRAIIDDMEFPATFVACRPDLGGYVVAATGEDGSIPGEQWVTQYVTLDRSDEAEIAATPDSPELVAALRKADSDVVRGSFTDAVAGAACEYYAAGLTTDDLRADFEAALSVQEISDAD